MRGESTESICSTKTDRSLYVYVHVCSDRAMSSITRRLSVNRYLHQYCTSLNLALIITQATVSDRLS